MTEIKILASFEGSNKILCLPNVEDASERVSSVSAAIRKLFNITENTDILIQKLDCEWNEYIDFEESSTLVNKDKIKVVVRAYRPAQLLQSCSIRTLECVPSPAPQPSPEQPLQTTKHKIINGITKQQWKLNKDDGAVVISSDSDFHDEDSIDDHNHDNADRSSILLTNGKSKKGKNKKEVLFNFDPEVESDHHVGNISPDQSTQTSSDTKQWSKLPSVVKLESRKVTEQPLPDPFVLPVHYRYDVEVCLSQGRMTKEATKSFISTVASKMFGYKKKPTASEYLRVATDIIRKYPFMKPTDGDPMGTIKQCLMNRFKEFRRFPRKRNQQESKSSISLNPKRSKFPGHSCAIDTLDAIMKPPAIPSGEDETSFERHKEGLILENKKANPNRLIVTELMEQTFAFRRKKVLEEPCTSNSVSSMCEEYPFLHSLDQIILDMQRILQVDQLEISVRDNWVKVWASQIWKQIQNENKKQFLSNIFDITNEDEQIYPIVSFAVLPYLLPDPRTKPTHENLIWAIPETLDINRAVESKAQSKPYILVIGSYKNPSQAFLVIDCLVVCEISNIDNAPLALLSAFFVFNISYPRGLNNVYTFLEHALLSLQHKHVTPTVGQFLAGIHATKA